jgi:hypothetical protein
MKIQALHSKTISKHVIAVTSTNWGVIEPRYFSTIGSGSTANGGMDHYIQGKIFEGQGRANSSWEEPAHVV